MTELEKEEFEKELEEKKAMRAEIKEKEKEALLMVYSGGRGGMGGKYIIGNELYEFSILDYDPKKERHNRKIKDLNDKELNKVIRFIKWNLLYRLYRSFSEMDAYHYIIVNYKGKNKCIKDPVGSFEEKGIFKKAYDLLDSLSKTNE